MNSNNTQLRDLIRRGFTREEACAALGIDVDAGEMALLSGGGSSKEKVNLQELREDFIPRALEILKDIAENGERDSDKIKACQIIIQGEGIMPEIGASDYSERIRRMKLAMGEVIEVGFGGGCNQLMAVND